MLATHSKALQRRKVNNLILPCHNQHRRTYDYWQIKKVMLEIDILVIALKAEVPKIKAGNCGIVVRAQYRGLVETLAEKVLEAKALIKQRRQANRIFVQRARVDNK